jgi:hypothetical protein
MASNPKSKKRLTLKILNARLKACESQIEDLYELLGNSLQLIDERYGNLTAMVQAIAGEGSTPRTVH